MVLNPMEQEWEIDPQLSPGHREGPVAFGGFPGMAHSEITLNVRAQRTRNDEVLECFRYIARAHICNMLCEQARRP